MKENQPFIFYTLNYGMLINICDDKCPKPSTNTSVWTKNGWIHLNNSLSITTYNVPNWLVNKEDIENCFEEQIRATVEKYYKDKDYKNFNMFLFTKIKPHGYSDIGMAVMNAKGNTKDRNKRMENYIKRINNLRIFL